MVELILYYTKQSDEEEDKKKNFISMATLDNQTPLARVLCHPAVTSDLVQKILDEIPKIDDKQLLVAFDMVARHSTNTKKPLDYLSPLTHWIKNNYQATLSQLPHIICRHNNKRFLEWFYDEIIKVRLCSEYLVIFITTAMERYHDDSNSIECGHC